MGLSVAGERSASPHENLQHKYTARKVNIEDLERKQNRNVLKKRHHGIKSGFRGKKMRKLARHTYERPVTNSHKSRSRRPGG